MVARRVKATVEVTVHEARDAAHAAAAVRRELESRLPAPFDDVYIGPARATVDAGDVRDARDDE